MDIGKKLKEKREKLGIPLEKASSDTLINQQYLEALENNRFTELPAKVYTMGFLRNYALYLGLNPEEFIEEYKKLSPQRTNGSLIYAVESISLKNTGKTRKHPLINTLIVRASVIAASIVLLSAITVIIIKKSKPAEEPAVETQQQVVHKKNILKLSTTENVWVRIRSGNEPLFEGLIPPNTEKIFESDEQFVLKIGNLTGLTVTINGEPAVLPKSKFVSEIKLP